MTFIILDNQKEDQMNPDLWPRERAIQIHNDTNNKAMQGSQGYTRLHKTIQDHKRSYEAVDKGGFAYT